MANEPLNEQEIHDLLTRARIEPSSEFKTELRSWLRIRLRQRLQKENTNGYHSIWHCTGPKSRYLYKGHNNMKKITPLAAVLSFGFLAVVVAIFAIVLIASPQREGSFASVEETATPESPETDVVMLTPTVEVLPSTPTSTLLPTPTPTPILLPPGVDLNSMSIGAQIDILIRALHPEFYTYNEILVDDDGVQVREARYYSNDSFVILTERMAADQPLPQGEEIALVSQPVILVEGLEGEALLIGETLQDGISRPFLGGGGGGGGSADIELTQGVRLFPEVIEYTDGSMVGWNTDGEQITILTNLPEDDLLDIARLAMEVQLGTLQVGIPAYTPAPPEPGSVVFEYYGQNYGFSATVENLMFKPLQPHYLPAVLFTSQADDETYGTDTAANADGSSVELRVFKVKSEEFVIIRQWLPDPVEMLDPSDGDAVVEVNGLPAVMFYNPECSLEVPLSGGGVQEITCTDSWSLNWIAEGLRIEVIGNNLPRSEAVQIANNMQ